MRRPSVALAVIAGVDVVMSAMVLFALGRKGASTVICSSLHKSIFSIIIACLQCSLTNGTKMSKKASDSISDISLLRVLRRVATMYALIVMTGDAVG